ncbi:MAG: transcription termination factor NusA, partial [Clostridia bacterium]|nr:transcription termination factor NusA [Clostridia bacterium]
MKAAKAAPNPANEFIEALNDLANERHIDREMLFTAIETALVAAYKRNFAGNGGSGGNVRVSIDRDRGEVEVFARKVVCEEPSDPQSEISLENARQINPVYGIGDLIEEKITPRQFGRIAAQTAKQVVVQKIREAERGNIYNEYIEKENEILTALVQRIEGKEVFVELGRTEGVLEASQQMPGETFKVNDRIKVYVLEVNKTSRGPQIMVSRIHPGLVKRLFEIEVPEIQSGVVQIKSIAREAGSRTKMAVFSTDP